MKTLGRAEHPGDAYLSLRDATVTRTPCDGPPTCDALQRIDRSDASSTALRGFGLKLEHHI
jgi:hypothetical protein